MSRPQHHHHPEDIEAAGALAIPLPPPSLGDPFHRRNKQHDANKNPEKSANSSSITDPESHDGGGGSAEKPRGNPVLGKHRSGSVGSSNAKSPAAKQVDPKLLHPLLLKIPLHIRFGLNGLLTNVLVSGKQKP